MFDGETVHIPTAGFLLLDVSDTQPLLHSFNHRNTNKVQ